MEAMEYCWFSSPTHDLPFTPMEAAPIRRHCTEGVLGKEADIDGHAGEWDEALLDIEAWSSSWDSSSPPCSGATNEEIGFVDSFINSEEEFMAPENPSPSEAPDTDIGTVDRGLHLVHLLLSCAEAVGCRDTRLAASTLSQIWPLADPSGDSLQRVSFCFATGLKSRLSLLHNVGMNGSLTAAGGHRRPQIAPAEKAESFHLLYQNTPYIAFAFLAANDAICQASQGKDTIHIVDLGLHHALQFPSLIRTLASRAGGPPRRVRITGFIAGDGDAQLGMGSVIAEAAAMGVRVEFRAISETLTPETLTPESLDLREECLVINSIMQLHRHVKESRGSLKAILTAIKRLRPAVVAVVEQDANHNGPFFLARFLESLHYYSAVFDSLEASMGRESVGRGRIERSHFGEEIRSVVADEGGDRTERHERADQWRRQMGRAGFQVVGMRCMSQARMMVSVYGCEGYTLGGEKGCLLLGWRGRPIMWASAWQVHTPPSSAS